jgi:hypothetical protein
MAYICKKDPTHPSQTPVEGAPSVEGHFPQEDEKKSVEKKWRSWEKAPLHGEEIHRLHKSIEKLRKVPFDPNMIKELMRFLEKRTKEKEATDSFDRLLKGVETFFKDLWEDLSPLTHLFSANEDNSAPNS